MSEANSEGVPQGRLRQGIEDGLGRWAHLVERFRWPIVAAVLVLTAGLASLIPQMEVKMASEDFLFEDDPVRAVYDAFRHDFGQDQVTIVAISPPEIFDLGFLEKLEAFHRDLEDELPYLEEVTSLVNVRSTYGRGDELVVEDLLDEMPTNAEELAAFEERVLNTPFYVKTGILSSDRKMTGVRVEVAVYGDGSPGEAAGEDDLDLGGFEETAGDTASTKRAFLSGTENAAVIEALHSVAARHASPDFPILTAGGTMLTYELTKQLGVDVPRFFGGGLVMIAVVLFALFRRIAPIFLCVGVVVPATMATFGLASYFHLPFSAPAQLIPSFLLAIGVSYSVHLLTIFLTDLGEGRERVASLEHALRHTGLPILMTGLTTSAGLLSFLVAPMKPIAEMGMISVIGVIVMLFYSLVFLPAMMVLLPMKGRARREGTAADRVLASLAAVSARHPWPIVGATLLLLVAAVAGSTRLYASSDPTSWFPADHPYRVASELVNDRFGGTSAIEVVVDTGREDGLKEPAVLARLEEVDALVAEYRSSGARLSYSNSLVDIAKETHQALNANDAAYYVVPGDRRLLAQELLLFENSGSEDLEKVVDPQFSRARYTIRSGWTDGIFMRPFLADFEPQLASVLGDVGSYSLTGMSSLIARTVDAIYESILRSYVLALCLITPLMILLIGSLRSGLVSMVPNLVPIAMTLGLMGAIGIPLDMFTLLAGCIAIGLAVDDSIHFIAGFRRYLAQGLDPVRAVEETMQSTGRALLFTSIVLTSGFGVLTMSEMLNLWNVGVLTSFAIGAAFLLDVTVTPALLVLTHRREADAHQQAARAD
ncbi:MAG: efflux RND transporter permease subunit [bacterium]|nr:efflux RND transporter permease subunit [bacterium]